LTSSAITSSGNALFGGNVTFGKIGSGNHTISGYTTFIDSSSVGQSGFGIKATSANTSLAKSYINFINSSDYVDSKIEVEHKDLTGSVMKIYATRPSSSGFPPLIPPKPALTYPFMELNGTTEITKFYTVLSAANGAKIDGTLTSNDLNVNGTLTSYNINLLNDFTASNIKSNGEFYLYNRIISSNPGHQSVIAGPNFCVSGSAKIGYQYYGLSAVPIVGAKLDINADTTITGATDHFGSYYIKADKQYALKVDGSTFLSGNIIFEPQNRSIQASKLTIDPTDSFVINKKAIIGNGGISVLEKNVKQEKHILSSSFSLSLSTGSFNKDSVSPDMTSYSAQFISCSASPIILLKPTINDTTFGIIDYLPQNNINTLGSTCTIINAGNFVPPNYYSKEIVIYYLVGLANNPVSTTTYSPDDFVKYTIPSSIPGVFRSLTLKCGQSVEFICCSTPLVDGTDFVTWYPKI